MKRDLFGISIGGEQRLRKAVEIRIREQHRDELLAATDPPQKAAIEKRIKKEIGEQMKRLASPQSLWNLR